MEYERIPRPGEIYRHYKDKLYQILTVAQNTENNELLVIYQALYGDYRTFARPLVSFMSELDSDKQAETGQKYRFELVKAADYNWIGKTAGDKLGSANKAYSLRAEGREAETARAAVEHKSEGIANGTKEEERAKIDKTAVDEQAARSVLLSFLEADSYSEKLDIVYSGKKHLNDRVINDMSVALDCTIEDGPLDERIANLINCLQALRRFENRRLR